MIDKFKPSPAIIVSFCIWANYSCKICWLTDFDNCKDLPCQNGGTCVDGVGSYACNCEEGFLGNNCEYKGNFCN